MTGINFIDTIVVRHSLERGTASEDKPVLPAEFMGKETTKANEEERERFRKILFCCIFSAFFGYLINDLFIFSVVSVSPTFWSLIGATLAIKNIPIR